MTILGIDPGLASLGWGIVQSEGGRLTHLAHGVLTTAPKSPPEERLLFLYNEISHLIELYHPEQAAVEKLYFMKNVTSGLPVAEVRGVLLLALAQARLVVGQYDPTQIKSSVVGAGHADKGQVQEMVRLLLGLASIPKPDHAADALAVAVCHVHRVQVNSVLEKYAHGKR
ncbi:MAG: crossover junction endodeoxyribonuclease RuvC [Spirochaetales bacterium]|nr:crossover junction endodeoxyribonuclease RuvC [Spirochaetales bacterium]